MTNEAHDFDASLAESQETASAPWWGEIYRRAFPSFKSMTIAGRDMQRDHVDRIIKLENGHSFNVEEKVRPRDWPDFALEIWSKEEERKRGWMCEDGHADYLAYVFMPHRRCWLLPWPQLRLAWASNSERWIREHGKRSVPNKPRSGAPYTTVICPVPIPVVIQAIKDAFAIGWGSRDLPSFSHLSDLPDAASHWPRQQEIEIPGHALTRHKGRP